MLFIQSLFSDNPTPALIQIFVVIFAVCCHEFAHAWVAMKQGDPTAAEAGHLTLNPLKQMGIMSLLMLAFIGLAWGQVPVSPSRMRHKYSEALTAFAGPLMNLILFFIFSVALVIVANFLRNPGLLLLFSMGASINMTLFIFNMLPIPSLDGWTVISHTIMRRIDFNSEFVKGATIFVIFLVIIFLNYLLMAGQFIAGMTVNLLQYLLVVSGAVQG